MSSATPRIMGPLQLAKKHLAQQYLLGKEIAVTFLKMPQFPNVSYHILYSAILSNCKSPIEIPVQANPWNFHSKAQCVYTKITAFADTLGNDQVST